MLPPTTSLASTSSAVTPTFAMAWIPLLLSLSESIICLLFVPNTLFLFCGRSASKIKGFLWESDSLLLLYKHVEYDRFSWLHSSNELHSMNSKQLRWLMQGFSIAPLSMTSVQGNLPDFYKIFVVQNRKLKSYSII